MEPFRSEPETALNALEQRLGGWQPMPGTLNRDRMMFEAGRAAAQRGTFRLVAIGGLMLLVAGLGGLLAHERSQRQVLEGLLAMQAQSSDFTPPKPDSPVLVPPASPVVVELDPDSYLALTHRRTGSILDDFSAAAQEPLPTRSTAPLDPPLSPLRARTLGGSLEL